MNWVGGARNRYMKNKDETMKLKAFFQKQRMKKKSKYVEFTKEQSSGNVDMLSLFIVNQMASKKEQTEKPTINYLTGAKRTHKVLNGPLEFPMSPCPPSNLNLVTSQPKYSSVGAPGFKTRKHRLSEGFKPLSPVFESNLSDVSGSENQEQPFSSSANRIKAKPYSSPSTESCDNMKNGAQLASGWTDVSNEVSMQDMPVSGPIAGLQFESTLPMPEMSENSEALVMFPVNNFECSEQQEEPQFIDFKNIDYKVLSSLNSCNGSQNMDNDDHFSTQESACTDSNSCADGSRVFMNVPEPSRRAPLNLNYIEAQKHDGNPTLTLDTGTQTAALSYRDVSVQCSLIQHGHSVSVPAAPQELSVLTTRGQSFVFNPCNVATRSSLKDGLKSTGNRPLGASATKQPAQRYPKLQTGFSFLKLRQMRMKRDLTSNLIYCSYKASEQSSSSGKAEEK